jgi:hypothetical protein
VEAGTAYVRLRVRRVGATSVGFQVENGTEAIVGTDVPGAVGLQPFVAVQNAGVEAARSVQIDFCDLKLWLPSR